MAVVMMVVASSHAMHNMHFDREITTVETTANLIAARLVVLLDTLIFLKFYPISARMISCMSELNDMSHT